MLMIITDDREYFDKYISWEYFKSDPELEQTLRNRLTWCRELCFCNMSYYLGMARKEGIEIKINMS